MVIGNCKIRVTLLTVVRMAIRSNLHLCPFSRLKAAPGTQCEGERKRDDKCSCRSHYVKALTVSILTCSQGSCDHDGVVGVECPTTVLFSWTNPSPSIKPGWKSTLGLADKHDGVFIYFFSSASGECQSEYSMILHWTYCLHMQAKHVHSKSGFHISMFNK